MTKMESLEKQLASQKEEHKATIHSVEIKALMERKRWPRDAMFTVPTAGWRCCQ